MKKQKIDYDARLVEYAKLPEQELKNKLMIHEFGEATTHREREVRFGLNGTLKLHFNWLKIILHQLIQPFNVLMFALIGLDMVSYFIINKGENETADLVSTAVSIAILMITFSTALIEGRNAFSVNLKTTTVIADSFDILQTSVGDLNDYKLEDFQKQTTTILFRKITIGDVLLLSPGDIVPADGRLIWVNNFAVDDSYIRGATERIKKSIKFNQADEIFDIKNLVLSQSIVTDGYALCVVISIGFEKTAMRYMKKVRHETRSFFHRGLRQITFSVLLSTLVVFPVSLISVYFSGNEKNTQIFIESILYAITIVVVLIPESLPAVLAFNLQHGSRHIRSDNLIVKNIEAVQDLGAIDIFASNKTGSITNDKPSLLGWFDSGGESTERVADLAYLNAKFQTSRHFYFEKAIIEHFKDKNSVLDGYKLIRSKKINEAMKDGSVILIKDDVMHQITVSTMEALEETLRYFRQGDEIIEITEELHETVIKDMNDWFEKGYRIMVVASKLIINEDDIDNHEMMFEGVLIFRDQVLPDVKEAMIMFEKYNIDFKILSAENQSVVKNVSDAIELQNLNILNGDKIANLSGKELFQLLDGINAFARLTPTHRAKIIDGYVKNNKTIAYLGDGVNDISAIRKADVGIAPNDSTPLAKAFADIIINDKSLMNFDEPIKWGRKTFLNTLKFIKLSISTNLGLFFALLAAGIWFPFLPLTPIQLLIQNLFIDFANISFMTDNVNSKSLYKPIKWNTKSIIHFAIINSIIPAAISLINLAIVCYGLNWFDPSLTNEDLMAKKIQTVFYLESFISRITMILLLRTDEIFFWKDLPRWKFLSVMLGVLCAVEIIPYIPGLSGVLGMAQPDPIWWAIMAGNFVSLSIIGNLVKLGYKSVFRMWF